MLPPEILARARELDISLSVDCGDIIARPKGATPHDLAQAIRVHKPELLAYLGAEHDRVVAGEALALLRRLAGYVLPSGGMPVVRALAERMRDLADPAAILSALQDFERELVALGGEYDGHLAETVAMVESTFPGARLVELRSRQGYAVANVAPKPGAAQEGAPDDLRDGKKNETGRLARTDGWTPPAELAPEVAAEIRRIEPAALALGWRYERLWNSRFWPHSAAESRGLASVMTPGDEIAEVRADCITILHRRRDLLRFSRIDG